MLSLTYSEVRTTNNSMDTLEDADRIYETLSYENEDSLGQEVTSFNTHSYPGGHLVGNSVSTQPEYAKETYFPKSSIDTSAGKRHTTNDQTYHNLAQEQATCDNYSCSNNHHIDSSSLAEHEYACIQDLDLHESSLRTKSQEKQLTCNDLSHDETLNQPNQISQHGPSFVHRTNVDKLGSSKAMVVFPRNDCSAVYHTLEKEEPALTEPKYSYATNAGVLPVHTETTNGEHYYSTLEEATDFEEPQVKFGNTALHRTFTPFSVGNATCNVT